MSLTPEQSHFLQNLRLHLIDLSRRLEQDVNENVADYELFRLQLTSNQALYMYSYMNYLTRITCFRGVHGLIIVPFYDILTAQTFECVAQFCEWIPIYWGNVPSVYRGGSRGRVPGVRTPPEMTCGFVIQLVFCQKKNYVVYWCWSRAREKCTPS